MRKIATIGIAIILYSVSVFTTFNKPTINTKAKEADYEVAIEEISTVPESTTEVETITIIIPTTEEITTIEETTVVITTEATTTGEQEATEETTTKKKERESEQEATKPEETTTKKKEKETKEEKTTKKKVNNKVPDQTQSSGAIGADAVDYIKNTVMSAMTGTPDSNLENLAIYMAKNGKSNAQSCLNSLCENTTLKVTSSKAKSMLYGLDEESLFDTAMALAEQLRASVGKYGIGIHSKATGDNTYEVTVVVVVQTN